MREILVVILILISATGAFLYNRELQSKTITPLRVAMINWTGFYPVLVASELGYFKKYGLEVSISLYKDNPEANHIIESGDAEIAFGPLTDHLLLLDTGIPLKFFYVSDYSLSDTLIGRPEIKSLKDLKGKTIGIGDINSFSELFVSSMLERAGIHDTDIKYKTIPFYEIKEALDQGLIDAGHTWDQEVLDAEKSGYSIIDTSALIPGIITDGAFYRTDLITDKKKLVDFLKAYQEAVELHSSNPKKYSAAVAKRLNITPEVAQEIISTGSPPMSAAQNKLAFSKGESLEHLNSAIELSTAFFRNRGQIKRDISYENAIDGSILEMTLGEKP